MNLPRTRSGKVLRRDLRELVAREASGDVAAPELQELQQALAAAARLDLPAVHHDEKAFRWALNEDAMATEKLAEGIRAFAVDAGKLDGLLERARA